MWCSHMEHELRQINNATCIQHLTTAAQRMLCMRTQQLLDQLQANPGINAGNHLNCDGRERGGNLPLNYIPLWAHL